MNYNSLFLNVRYHPIACQDKTIHLKNFFHSVPSHIIQGSEGDITILKIFALLEFFSRFSKKQNLHFAITQKMHRSRAINDAREIVQEKISLHAGVVKMVNHS
ncbi:MAG: hypothetical protein NT106_03280 [Candidatus Sumerlaeota bacterium]|nr:hypothetical protein [Candidatus Sumerlaeota bacterium]